MLIKEKMAMLRAARMAKIPPINQAAKAPGSATRYYHTLSNGGALHLAVWQVRKDGAFQAIVRRVAGIFTGHTHEEAMRRLVEHYEQGEIKI